MAKNMELPNGAVAIDQVRDVTERGKEDINSDIPGGFVKRKRNPDMSDIVPEEPTSKPNLNANIDDLV